jgi:very-short-patch-repair endonuclease
MHFSKNKERKLVELYPTTDDHEIARILKLSVGFVRKKAEELELEKEDIDEWTPQEMKLLIEMYPNSSNESISEIVGRSKMEVDHYAFRMGLSKSKEYFSNIISTPHEEALAKHWNDEYSQKDHGNSRGNYILGNVLRHIFPLCQIHPEYPLGGLRLDFYMPTLSLGFEFDGIQHQEYNSFFYKTKDDFHKAQSRDYDKSEMAEALGIAIVRFSHDEQLSIALVRAKISEVV